MARAMHVSLTRSGGFAGMTRSAELDSDRLSADEARELEAKIADVAFFDLPGVIGAAGVPDAFQYELTVDDGERRHTVRAGERSAPEALLDLISFVEGAARAAGG